MKNYRSYLLAFVFVVVAVSLGPLFPWGDGVSTREAIASAPSNLETLSKVQKLSIPFIPNQGQTDKRVKFYANTFGGSVFVTEKGEIIYSLPKIERERKSLRREGKVSEGWVLKEELVGGRVKQVRAEEEALSKVSYFIGNDSSQWRSNIPTYGLVSLGEVYKGIEVKLRAYGRSVEKLFDVKAGTDPGKIRLKLSGGESLKVNGDGVLEVKTALGDVRFSKPVAYQEMNGKKVEVAVDYHLLVSNNSSLATRHSSLTYGFKVGDYDRTRTFIDPLLQSTYLGGSGDDVAHPIAIDPDGNVYVAGYTYSTNFPGTTGGAQATSGGGADAFVTRLNSTLTAILQSTYLGGSGIDEAYSIAIDSGGNVYVAGYTSSTNFPGTTEGAQPSSGGGGQDAFVTMLNSNLTVIFQSTYLGGSGIDIAESIAVDPDGNVYVAGQTYSTNFPGTTGGAQPSSGGGSQDAFVTMLNPNSDRHFSIHLPGREWY